MKRLSRRDFLKTSAWAGVSLAAPSVLGVNEDIRVGIIGLGGKGGSHLEVFDGIKGVRVVALCDVDPQRLARKKEKLGPGDVFETTDFRRVLDRKDVDAVVVATCNHWHGPMTVLACQAGKDVYVEKPISHNLKEGRLMIQACEDHGRIVQSGTQYRSDPGLRAAAEYIQQGNLGRMLYGYVLWYELRGSIGKKDPWVPDWLDYDLYCGPAEREPLERDKLHYDWHWVWATGDGDLANSGIHAFDACRMFAGYDKLPERSFSIGGRFAVDDAGQTPNTQITVLEYEPAPIVIENRNLPAKKGRDLMDHYLGVREGFVLRCEDGYFAGFRGGGWMYDNDGKKIEQFKGDGGGSHQANFIEAVRSRKAKVLKAPLIEGHISSGVCHLGNLSFRLGKAANQETILQKMEDVGLAKDVFHRLEAHLAANEVDLEKTPLHLGPWLSLDLTKETVVQCDGSGERVSEANRLASGSYRDPFDISKGREGRTG